MTDHFVLDFSLTYGNIDFSQMYYHNDGRGNIINPSVRDLIADKVQLVRARGR